MYTNATMQAMVDQFGERICAICLNNNKKLYIGYTGKTSVQLSDISFETIGGCDMMKVKRKDLSSNTPISYVDYITTEFIENVLVMDEEYKDYRVMPMHM